MYNCSVEEMIKTKVNVRLTIQQSAMVALQLLHITRFYADQPTLRITQPN